MLADNLVEMIRSFN